MSEDYSDFAGLLGQFGSAGWTYNNEPTVTVPLQSMRIVVQLHFNQLVALPSNTLYELEVMPVVRYKAFIYLSSIDYCYQWQSYKTYKEGREAYGWNWRLVDVVVHGLVVSSSLTIAKNKLNRIRSNRRMSFHQMLVESEHLISLNWVDPKALAGNFSKSD